MLKKYYVMTMKRLLLDLNLVVATYLIGFVSFSMTKSNFKSKFI